jgi:hypothetical protein
MLNLTIAGNDLRCGFFCAHLARWRSTNFLSLGILFPRHAGWVCVE